MHEMTVPAAALRDPESIEVLRVWIAEKSLWCSIKVGMYRETMNVSEEKAWGTILADATRHIANALAKGYEADASITIERIRQALLDELADPTSKVSGDFI
ncbi:DUF5076 domain-containing protein [Bradyrhizobium sp. NAS96.2]|uniref:DUF5076 domain-containing protein n=1 Tax=Bradyrhizobium sp. NAS96.2 TaxID=1680160 RepID=UPI00093A5005|nr:DUF5076 domain-containing protein [Bradyrhizobium sp. NAS96.2]OKO81156.1 hypothetical protein AC628_07280 [Bradyrhizobium sp. NAS96.2]